MNKIKYILPLMAIVFSLASCSSNNLVDTNDEVASNSWTYAKSAKAVFEIKDNTKSYHLYFKLRHTADYRYANLFVLVNLKGNGLNKKNRYEFKLAETTGDWTGKGSGNIFNHKFLLLSNYRFSKPGMYEIEVEQNMRDNPLIGISDVGVLVVVAEDN